MPDELITALLGLILALIIDLESRVARLETLAGDAPDDEKQGRG
jgi:hypothetical protein